MSPANPIACPPWCALPAGHGPDGDGFTCHLATVPAGAPRHRVDLALSVEADGAEEPLVILDGPLGDGELLTPAQARQLAAALTLAARLADGAR